MNITHDLHYGATLMEVLDVLRSEELLFGRLQKVGHPDYELAHDIVDGKKRTEVTISAGPNQIPEQVAMFVGKNASVTVTSLETVTDAGAQIDYLISTKLPVKCSARMLLVNSGTSTAGKLEIHLSVSVPIAGAMIERSIENKIPHILDKDTELVNEILERKRSEQA
ncbi:DUF2505 domain-containing protein [Arcanobacterium pinnipediorum]|uniref:DUF2505 domain-containing protein n=1 Tax=Arcanobacterium pinnipediorum TaxID=1503041 RepID=A0ABY5AIF6_9ACTO|nr:DUF2505 domain-containing protein [Arcanobacterium pinnipediorum]USR79776.1 DUF2505 domain-containing protein [Arcanobacterium pinnipediorum]